MGTSYVKQAESCGSGGRALVPKPSGRFGNMGTEMADPDAGKSARVWLPPAPSSRCAALVADVHSPQRHEVRLDDRDMVAGAQILAWIAMPHRPQTGVRLLNQWFWARRRFRKESVPILPFKLDKPNRLTSQLVQFDRRVLDAFRAGVWFYRKHLAAIPAGGPIAAGLRGLGASTRQLAKSYAGRNGIEQGNAIRAIWSRRKPVLHLASAAAEVLAERYADEDRQGFDLERTVFWPNWVADTINRAEQKAEAAARYGGFQLSDFHRFHRDKN